MDPTEEMYIKTLSSFKFQIGFEELRFNTKYDLIAKSSIQTHYCSLYIGTWLGMRVTLKRFSHKQLMKEPSSVADFLHELEVAHSLRHPNIVLYMGLAIDPEKNHAYIVQEFVSKSSLFEILHGSEQHGTQQQNTNQKLDEQ